MEYCYRIAIWMFLLSGFLQAKPVSECFIDVSKIDVFDLELLTEVICEENVTFVSPASMPTNCPIKALKAIKDGLFHAKDNCKDESKRVLHTLETLTRIPRFFEMKTSSNYTSMGEGTRKQFEDFVKDIKSFIQRLKSVAAYESNKSQA